MLFGSTRYWAGSTRSILSEVRLGGMVDKNLLLESTYNTRIFELGVPHGPLLDGRRRSMDSNSIYPDRDTAVAFTSPI